MGRVFPGLNSNFIVLIPKTPTTFTVDQFWSIALGSFLFKIITIIIASWQAVICSCIISSNQFGFIRSRWNGDYIVGASECFNVLSINTCQLVVKIDFLKGVWFHQLAFLVWGSQALWVSEVFIGWVGIIFYSARSSVLIDGSPKGISDVLEVWDKVILSPLIFCLAEDFLSRYLARLVDSGSLLSIFAPVGMCAPIQFLYVDDVLLFCWASSQNLWVILDAFEFYGSLSGQHVNWVFQKSGLLIFFLLRV